MVQLSEPSVLHKHFQFCQWLPVTWAESVKGGEQKYFEMIHPSAGTSTRISASKEQIMSPAYFTPSPYLSSAASAASVLSSSSFFSRLLFSSLPNRSKISSSNACVILFWALYLLSTACSWPLNRKRNQNPSGSASPDSASTKTVHLSMHS